MIEINELFDEARKRIERDSDNHLAKILGVRNTTISVARKTGNISDDTARALADVLGRDEAEILAIAHYWRTEPAKRAPWEKLSKLAASAAAGVMLLILIPNSNLQTAELDLKTNASNNHYARL